MKKILIGCALTALFAGCCDHAADDRNFLGTQVIEAFVGDNASLELNCLEETHYKNVRVSNVYIEQQRDSRVNHNVITLHNGTTRNQLDLVNQILDFRKLENGKMDLKLQTADINAQIGRASCRERV